MYSTIQVDIEKNKEEVHVPGNKKRIDLSIIVTAHAEGILLHKTLKSIARALKEIENTYNFEILLHLDNPNIETEDYVNRAPYREFIDRVKVFRNNFGDPGEARNFCIQKSKSKYVSIVDGDDLYGKTIFANALKILEKNPYSIVHPGYIVSFGLSNSIERQFNSGDNTRDRLAMIRDNLWGSSFTTLRSIMLKHPYRRNGDAFGYEDKQFNADTLADKIPHIVSEDVRFYRRRLNSVFHQHTSHYSQVSKTALFKFSDLRKLKIDKYWKSAFPVKKSLMLEKPNIANRVVALGKRFVIEQHMANRKASKLYAEFYDKITSPLHAKRDSTAAELKKQVKASKLEKFPSWLLEEWRSIHQIEQEIFPSEALLEGIKWYDSSNNIKPGLIYVKMLKQLSKAPDTVFFVPWLIHGGADKVFINYINQLSSVKKWNIAVFQTNTDIKSIRSSSLLKSVDFLDFASAAKPVNHEVQIQLLSIFITQNNVKRLFIANSYLGYLFIRKYETLIKELGVTVYSFAFAEGYDTDGRRGGYVHTDIPYVYDISNKIITDNKRVIKQLADEYGIDTGKFITHYQPANFDIRAPINRSSEKIKILWASRVCKSKRPDILKKIDALLDHDKVEIHVFGTLEEGYTEEYFEDSQVKYKRSFNGIADLPVSNYDIFLYTSESDGMPNMIQEITAVGLPIIASDVGGIGEFIINNETGKLVADYENPELYVSAIHDLLDGDLRLKLVKGAQASLSEMFNEARWLKQVDTDIQ